MTPYETYIDYLAIKRHFTVDDYDYFRYNGKVKANYTSFENRKDRYFFEKLSNKPHAHELLLVSISKDPNAWIGSISGAEEDYKAWRKVISRMDYTFVEEVKKIPDLAEYIKVENGEHPKLLKLLLRNEISKETFIILNQLLKFVPSWNKKISDTIVWPEIYFNLKKYSAFITIDEYKYKDLLKKVIQN